MPSYVYILASTRKGTLYTGVTSDILQRISEHKLGIKCNFTKRYNVKLLVYYEAHEDILVAIEREKEIKKWKRQWKIDLIERANPHWHDIFSEIAGSKWIAS